MHRFAAILVAFSLAATMLGEKPEWCRNLPRPAYKKLEQISVRDQWFEVYRVRPGVFALYEPHQAEEVISYLITGSKRALLFDTGLGISNIRNVAEELTSLPLIVLNSHTHNDHVGENWRFQAQQIYAMDTAFTRANAKGSRGDAQAEIAPDQLCGPLPPDFDAQSYSTKPFHVGHWMHDGDQIDLGGRVAKIIAVPGHTPDSIALLDERNGLLFTGDTYYPGPIFLYRPETDLDAYTASVKKLARLAPGLNLLLPSHNVPVAQPGELQRVLTAIKEVRSGRANPIQLGDKWEYKFGGFSFLMSANKP